MPHLTFEYTNNLATCNADRLLLARNHSLIDSGHFNEMDVDRAGYANEVLNAGSAS